MSLPPPCKSLGPQCRRLLVTLRVGSLEDGAESLDHEATWLLGHTQRIQFGDLWEDEGDLYVEAAIHVACRYFRADPSGSRCTMYGFTGPVPRRLPRTPQPRRLGADRFTAVERRRLRTVRVTSPPRSLPVLNGTNPCATAPCRTSDHTHKAACCRDMELEIMCDEQEIGLESLVRHRQSPYLCKVDREGPFSLSAEVISACDYLDSDGIACTLHGKLRSDGRPAKPDLCSEWPHQGRELHPGCVFKGGKAVRR